MDTIMKPKYIFNYLIIAIFKVHLHHNCSCFHSPGSSWKEGCGKLTGGQGLVPPGRLLLLPRPRPGPRKRPLILRLTGNDEHCWVSHGDTDGDGGGGCCHPSGNLQSRDAEGVRAECKQGQLSPRPGAVAAGLGRSSVSKGPARGPAGAEASGSCQRAVGGWRGPSQSQWGPAWPAGLSSTGVDV